MRLACYLMLRADPRAARPADTPRTPALGEVPPAASERVKAAPRAAAIAARDYAQADEGGSAARGPRSGCGAGQRRAAMRTRV